MRDMYGGLRLRRGSCVFGVDWTYGEGSQRLVGELNSNKQGKESTSREIWRSTGSSSSPVHVPRISRLLNSGVSRWKSSACLVIFSR